MNDIFIDGPFYLFIGMLIGFVAWVIIAVIGYYVAKLIEHIFGDINL